MGRELRRVPIDFNWPIDQLWKGFVNPFHCQECKQCKGSGLNKETKKISDDWYAFDKDDNWVYPDGPRGRRWNNSAWSNHLTDVEVEALVKEGRMSSLMDNWYSFDEETNKWTYLKEESDKPRRDWKWVECEKPTFPTAEAVNEWNRGTGMGHDSINQHTCVRARAKHLGVYGKCEICGGEGVIWQTPKIKKMHENWKSFGPPKGKGFQLWSTTSEGHPMTPVFKTLELLCEHLEKDKVSLFGSSTATKEEWMKMLDDGHVYYKDGNAIFI